MSYIDELERRRKATEALPADAVASVKPQTTRCPTCSRRLMFCPRCPPPGLPTRQPMNLDIARISGWEAAHTGDGAFELHHHADCPVHGPVDELCPATKLKAFDPLDHVARQDFAIGSVCLFLGFIFGCGVGLLCAKFVLLAH